MSNLSDLIPAGASGKTIEAVATANITSKAPVILNSAGTVTQVAVVTTSNSASIPTGTATTSNTDTPETMRLVFDPFDSTRFLFVYNTDAGSPRNIIKLRVGTISGTTITLNTVTTVYGTSASNRCSVAFDPGNENVFVVTYNSDTNVGYAKVGTISGTRGSESVAYGTAAQLTTIELGTDYTLFGANVQFVHGSTKKFILSFTKTANSYPYAVVFTYSGTTITSGTETVLNSSATDQQTAAIAVNTETAGNFVSGYVKTDSYLYVKSGNISGTTITMDSNETKIYTPFAGATVGGINWVKGTSDKFLWSSKGGTGSNRAICAVGTLTGTTFTGGTVHELNTSNTTTLSTSTSVSDSGVGGSQGGHEFIATFKESADNYLRGQPINVVGTTVTSGTAVVMVSANHSNGGVTPYGGMSDSVEGTFAIVYRENTALTTGLIRLGNAGGGTSNANLTATNFVGIADAAISSAATGTVVVQGGTITGLSSLTTGSKYYVQDDGSISSPTGAYPYNLSGGVYDSVSLAVSDNLTSIFFKPDGAKFYAIGYTNDTVYEYGLSTAFDLSTATLNGNTKSITAEVGVPLSLVFKTDGTKMYALGGGSVFQYSLSTAWDVSSASYDTKSLVVSSQDTNSSGVWFKSDGTEMYMCGFTNDSIFQYNLSTPWDVSTGSYASISFDMSATSTQPRNMYFDSTGTILFLADTAEPDKVFKFVLSTAWDITTISFSSSFDVSAQAAKVVGISLNADGTKMYVADSENTNTIYQYTLNGSTSSVPAGLAISTTSLLLNGDS